MSKQSQSYDPVGFDELHAELDDWQEEPVESVESRNHQISIHRRPGFYKKGLLGSIALNAILLIVCGWLYLKLTMYVSSSWTQPALLCSRGQLFNEAHYVH